MEHGTRNPLLRRYRSSWPEVSNCEPVIYLADITDEADHLPLWSRTTDLSHVGMSKITLTGVGRCDGGPACAGSPLEEARGDREPAALMCGVNFHCTSLHETSPGSDW